MPSKVQDKHEEHINTPIEKKPYEKPAILYRAPLEALAAACPPGGTPSGKNAIGQPGCTTTFS